MFALAFIGASYPIPSSSFQQVDATHWTLDVCAAVRPDYSSLKEAALLLASPSALPAPVAAAGAPPPVALGLGLFVRCGDMPASDPWLYRGCVHAGRPSEVVSLSWPTRPDTAGEPFPAVPGVTPMVGVSVEPLSDLLERGEAAGCGLGSQLQVARAVALDLSTYLASFVKDASGGGGAAIVLPPGAVDAWLARWEQKFTRDPDWVLRRASELIPPPPTTAPPRLGWRGGGAGG